jgi:hypothetical protein
MHHAPSIQLSVQGGQGGMPRLCRRSVGDTVTLRLLKAPVSTQHFQVSHISLHSLWI